MCLNLSCMLRRRLRSLFQRGISASVDWAWSTDGMVPRVLSGR